MVLCLPIAVLLLFLLCAHSHADCEKEFLNPEGNFTSPNFPSNYPDNADCTWTTTTLSGYVNLTILVTIHNIEPSSTCDYDYLKITDRLTGSELDTFCSSNELKQLEADSNSISVRFVTNNDKTAKGWEISWTSSKVDDIPRRRTVQWPNNTGTSLDDYQMLNIVDLLSSKTFPGFEVSLLTDGNLGVGGFGEGYYFWSNQEPERYILADIGDNHQVIGIKIYYRLSHPELVQNLKISVGKKLQDLELGNSFCAYREGNPRGNTTLEVLYCESAMIGRYIKVAMLNASIGQFFCFCELQIFGSNQTDTTPSATTLDPVIKIVVITAGLVLIVITVIIFVTLLARNYCVRRRYRRSERRAAQNTEEHAMTERTSFIRPLTGWGHQGGHSTQDDLSAPNSERESIASGNQIPAKNDLQSLPEQNVARNFDGAPLTNVIDNKSEASRSNFPAKKE